jgi:hypothetical protein
MFKQRQNDGENAMVYDLTLNARKSTN